MSQQTVQSSNYSQKPAVCRSKRTLLSGLAAVAVGALALGGIVGGGKGAWAHASATGVVKERMDLMKSMRDAMKELRPLMDATQLDQAAALPLASTIANASGQIINHFPEGSGGHPSEALPEIWSDWGGFQDAVHQGTEKANALVEAVKSGQGEQALRAYAHVAKACKDCHQDYKAD